MATPHFRAGPRIAWWAGGSIGPSLVAALAVALALASSAGAAQAAVAIQQRSFLPARLTVSVGDSVTWTVTRNTRNDLHSVTSGIPGTAGTGEIFDSGVVLTAKGDSFSFAFTKPGTFDYFCRVHPVQMTGTITVEAAPTPAPTPVPTPSPTPPPTATPAPSGTSGPGASATPVASPEASPVASAGASAPPGASVEPSGGGPSRSAVPPDASGVQAPEPVPGEPVGPAARTAAFVILLLTFGLSGTLLIAYRRVNR